MVHDIAYKYGFTEQAFNFQQNNFNHGGKGGDRVHLSVQDGSGLNNANFATPPEYVPFRNLYL
jgi:extracellular elastinolytic metalloproteinase